MISRNGLDINRVIREGTRRMDLDSLARLGHRNVRVIDEERIHELIARAVDQAIEADSADLAQRQRRLDAQKTRDELHQQLAEHQLEQVRSRDGRGAADGALEAEIAELQAGIADADRIIEEERRRIAEQSRQEFEKFLRSARAELEARAGGYEKALRNMIGRSQELVPAEELAALTPVGDEAGGDPAGLIAALGERLAAIDRTIAARGSQLDEMRGQLRTREEAIRIASRLSREQEEALARSKDELETVQRQFREQDEDIAIAARQRRALQSEIESVRRQLGEKERELAAAQAGYEATLREMLSRLEAAEREQAASIAAVEVRAQQPAEQTADRSDEGRGESVRRGAEQADGSPAAEEAESASAVRAGGTEAGLESTEPAEQGGPSQGSVVLARTMGERINRMAAQLRATGEELARRNAELEAALKRGSELRERAEAREAERDAESAARAEAEGLAAERRRRCEELERQTAMLQSALDGAELGLAEAKAGYEATLRDLLSRLEAAEREQDGPIVVVDVRARQPAEDTGGRSDEGRDGVAGRDAEAAGGSPVTEEAERAHSVQAGGAEAGREIAEPAEPAEPVGPSQGSVVLAQAMGERIDRLAMQLRAAGEQLASRNAELEGVRARGEELHGRVEALEAERDAQAAARDGAESRLAEAEGRAGEYGRRCDELERQAAGLRSALNGAESGLASAKADYEATLRDMLARLEAAEREPDDPIVVVDAQVMRPEDEAGEPSGDDRDALVVHDGESAGGPEMTEEVCGTYALQAATTEPAHSQAEPGGPSQGSVALAQAMGAKIRRLADQLGAARDGFVERGAELEDTRRRCLDLERRAAELVAERDALASAKTELEGRLSREEEARSAAEGQADEARRQLAALADELRQHEERTVQRLATLAGELSAAAGDYRERSGALGGRLTGLLGTPWLSDGVTPGSSGARSH